ncbi:hypothetical protein HAX54_017675, partial [Datura stramonium]|nr:hypothetical protein [Datura stramonium]
AANLGLRPFFKPLESIPIRGGYLSLLRGLCKHGYSTRHGREAEGHLLEEMLAFLSNIIVRAPQQIRKFVQASYDLLFTRIKSIEDQMTQLEQRSASTNIVNLLEE